MNLNKNLEKRKLKICFPQKFVCFMNFQKTFWFLVYVILHLDLFQFLFIGGFSNFGFHLTLLGELSTNLDWFIPNFKLKYEGSENIKADRVSTVVFNLHQIKRRAFFLGHPVYLSIYITNLPLLPQL